MRHAPIVQIEGCRVREGPLASSTADGNNGAFLFQIGATNLRVIVSDGGSWDHVSVSTSCRCPTWEEMVTMKRLFFRDNEIAIQYHPMESDYVNEHPYTLHLWRPQDWEVKLPPKNFV